MEGNVYKLPLAIIKQAVMKIDSANTDMHEIANDESMSDEDRILINQMADVLCMMEATLINIANEEIPEAEFLAEDLIMDEIEPYPMEEEPEDILATKVS